ncbi:MAG: hypothetical protein GKR90_26690 [Pseudomonadales bacterium]|nr:hypothetical protein [Pseudomonadales bacterium]
MMTEQLEREVQNRNIEEPPLPLPEVEEVSFETVLNREDLRLFKAYGLID